MMLLQVRKYFIQLKVLLLINAWAPRNEAIRLSLVG